MIRKSGSRFFRKDHAPLICHEPAPAKPASDRYRRAPLREYIFASARASTAAGVSSGASNATPADAPTASVELFQRTGVASITASSAAALLAAAAASTFHNSTTNSSPPMRATTSEVRT